MARGGARRGGTTWPTLRMRETTSRRGAQGRDWRWPLLWVESGLRMAERRVIHWFRRDLRLSDNTALHEAARNADTVIPVFCFDPAILRRDDMGAPRLAFLLDCLASLERNLAAAGSRLVLREGNPVDELPRLVAETGATAVYWNRDYSPYAVARDRAVAEAGERHGFETRTFKDQVIHESAEVRTQAGGVYTVFTPYSKSWLAQPKPPVLPRFQGKGRVPETLGCGMRTLEGVGWTLAARIPEGGERAARDVLKRFLAGPAARYGGDRDFPAVEGTSRLSPHLRFGTISPRTIFHAARRAGEDADPAGRKSLDKWVSELVWREFYAQILGAFPHVARGAFRPEYDALEWENDGEKFEAWKAGRTGYPIVDAAMRQLNGTGWMHNRLRMIVAMFLTKDLRIDWRWGEKLFMQRLVDGDLASNNGGWQWSAGTGTDAAPYFRIFSPVSQSRKFDPDGAFLRQWVPELRDWSATAIHAPWEAGARPPGYPAPIVDHAESRLKTLAMFQRARERAAGSGGR